MRSGTVGSPLRRDTCIDLSIVVPVFNSAPTLRHLYKRLHKIQAVLCLRSELVFVDDASVDESWQILQVIAKNDNSVTSIRLAANVGQGDATLRGLYYSRGKIVVTLDDDLQHPPEEIPLLLDELGRGERPAIVVGIPLIRQQSMWRRITSLAQHFVSTALLDISMPARFSAFRAMDRKIVQGVLDAGQPSLTAMTQRLANRVSVVRVQHDRSTLVRSRYSMPKLCWVLLAHLAAGPARRRWIVFTLMCLLFAATFAANLASIVIAEVSITGIWTGILWFAMLLSGASALALSAGIAFVRDRHRLVSRTRIRSIVTGDCASPDG